MIAEIEQAIDQIESRQLETLQAQQNREISYSFTCLLVMPNRLISNLKEAGVLTVSVLMNGLLIFIQTLRPWDRYG